MKKKQQEKSVEQMANNKVEKKKEKINTFSLSYILRFVYIGILEIFGQNKKRREKEGLITVVDEQNKPLGDYIYAGNDKKEEKKDKKDTLDSSRLKTFNYTIRLNNKKKYTNTIEALSKEDVESFYKEEGYEVLKVKEVKGINFNVDIGGTKLSANDLSFMLTQLSTYLKAGIPLIDSVKILAKQADKKYKRRIFDKLTYTLLMGEEFSEALNEQDKVFPAMLVNMVKTAEMTGDLPATLDDMADYYTSIHQTKKDMKAALTYPAVILVMAVAVTAFMLIYLVPQFVSMYEEQNATLPWITVAIMSASSFMKNNWIIIACVLAGLLILYLILYKHIIAFRKVMQKINMRAPIFGRIIIYNEVATFTKTFASLLDHGVRINESMGILLKITNNEVYKELIRKTIDNISKGVTVSEAYKGSWAFPVVAYEMIVTGENTGQLGAMMGKVADHFTYLHKNLISQMKSLVEPIMIIILAVIVGTIILSIIIPMFSIYEQIS